MEQDTHGFGDSQSEIEPRFVAKIFILDRINGNSFEWQKMRKCGSQECLITFNSQMISSFEMPRSPQLWHHSETNQIDTPIILGGFFMIHRRRFVDLGGFDEQLRIWGGENIEISGKFFDNHQITN